MSEPALQWEHAAAQAAFFGILQQLGFAVGSRLPVAWRGAR
jgi:hypothetical protein